MASRIENARDSILNEFRNISIANGYNTTPNQVINSIRHVDQIQVFPEIGVELGDETITPLDDAWTVFDSNVEVYVCGCCVSDTDTGDPGTNLTNAAEALLHDIKRIVASIYQLFNNRSNRWNVRVAGKQVEFFRVMNLGQKRNRAMVGCTFTIHVRNQDITFAEYILSEAGVTITNEQAQGITL